MKISLALILFLYGTCHQYPKNAELSCPDGASNCREVNLGNGLVLKLQHAAFMRWRQHAEIIFYCSLYNPTTRPQPVSRQEFALVAGGQQFQLEPAFQVNGKGKLVRLPDDWPVPAGTTHDYVLAFASAKQFSQKNYEAFADTALVELRRLWPGGNVTIVTAAGEKQNK